MNTCEVDGTRMAGIVNRYRGLPLIFFGLIATVAVAQTAASPQPASPGTDTAVDEVSLASSRFSLVYAEKYAFPDLPSPGLLARVRCGTSSQAGCRGRG